MSERYSNNQPGHGDGERIVNPEAAERLGRVAGIAKVASDMYGIGRERTFSRTWRTAEERGAGFEQVSLEKDYNPGMGFTNVFDIGKTDSLTDPKETTFIHMVGDGILNVEQNVVDEDRSVVQTVFYVRNGVEISGQIRHRSGDGGEVAAEAKLEGEAALDELDRMITIGEKVVKERGIKKKSMEDGNNPLFPKDEKWW